MTLRLYVAPGAVEAPGFLLAPSLAAAKAVEPSAKVCRDADLPLFWRRNGLDLLTASQVAERFGVSRQTVAVWRRRAGIEAAPRGGASRRDAVLAELRGGALVADVAARHQLHPASVRRLAQLAGVALAKRSRRMSDDQLVQLAEGKTWHELAQAAGLSLFTLRNRVYGDPALSRRIRGVMIGTTTRGL